MKRKKKLDGFVEDVSNLKSSFSSFDKGGRGGRTSTVPPSGRNVGSVKSGKKAARASSSAFALRNGDAGCYDFLRQSVSNKGLTDLKRDTSSRSLVLRSDSSSATLPPHSFSANAQQPMLVNTRVRAPPDRLAMKQNAPLSRRVKSGTVL